MGWEQAMQDIEQAGRHSHPTAIQPTVVLKRDSCTHLPWPPSMLSSLLKATRRWQPDTLPQVTLGSHSLSPPLCGCDRREAKWNGVRLTFRFVCSSILFLFPIALRKLPGQLVRTTGHRAGFVGRFAGFGETVPELRGTGLWGKRS